MPRRDRLKGGLADRETAPVDAEQLRMGIEVELEHTNDRGLAEEIARDHLVEDPQYYTHLEEMESKYARDESLTEEQAFAVLEPYFIAARSLFIAYCEQRGLGDVVKTTQFECRPDMHDTDRHFAGTTLDGRKVCAAPELAELPEDNVAAILAHEFGHVVDHRYPGRFVYADEELVLLAEVPEGAHRGDQARVARMKQWEGRDDDEIERVADAIAEQATGQQIGYSGPCMLQGLNRGKPRPKGLR